MDIIATLKINDAAGNLLHKEQQTFSDDMGYTLDEIIENYGDHIENYLIDRIDFNANDVGEVVLRFHYLALSDEIEDEDEGDIEEDETTYIEYEDGVEMYDMALTNERIVVRFGAVEEN